MAVKLQLTRYGSLPGIGTFGELHVATEKFHTVEREWLDNQKFVSCIPDGVYDLVPHSSAKYPNVWAMVNEELGVSHYDKEAKRYACLIHIANHPDQVSGCIGLGRELRHMNGKLGVTSSAISIERLRMRLNTGEKHTIEITWENLGEAA